MADQVPIGTEQLVGMSDQWKAKPNQPELYENVYLDREGCWRTCGGLTQAIDVSGQEVHSMHWFAQHNGGRQWLVWERTSTQGVGVLEYYNFATDTRPNLDSSRTLHDGITVGTSYTEHGDWLYFTNGYDAPSRWNGREYTQVGFTQVPPRPLVTVSDYDRADAYYKDVLVTFQGTPGTTQFNYGGTFQRGVGSKYDDSNKDTGRFLYGYAIQWINDRGMSSPPSGVSWLQGENKDNLAGATVLERQGVRSISVSLREAPGYVRGVRILRTINMYGGAAAAGVPLYPVAEFPTGAAINFNDDTPDEELLVPIDTTETGLWPSRAKYMHIFKGVAFVDEGADVRYSAPGFIEQMPSQNRITLGDATSGPVMGFKSTKNALVVFKRRGIYLIKGDPLNGFFAETLTEEIGCASPRAIVEVPKAGTLFLHDDGPYLLVGALENTGTPTEIVYVGQQVSSTWRKRVNVRGLLAAVATRHTRDREVWVQVPADGDNRPNLGLIFHYDVQGWSLRTDYSAACFAEARDHRGYLFVGSWKTTSSQARGIFAYTRGSTTSTWVTLGQTTTATTVESEVWSPWHGLGRTRSTAFRTEFYALNTGRDYTLDWRIDRQTESWPGANRSDLTLNVKDYEYVRDTWGGSTYAASTWSETVPVTLNEQFVGKQSHEFQWRIVGEKVAVFGYNTFFAPIGDWVKGNHSV